MMASGLGQIRQRKQCSREKENRQHHEVHDQLEALHVLEDRAKRRAQRREHDGDQPMNRNASGNIARVRRPKTGDQTDHEDQRALNHRDSGSAERSADHDFNARHGRDQRFFEEAELAVPKHGDPGEDRGKKNGHADHARARQIADSCRCPAF